MLLKSYIHSKVFVLTVGRNRTSITKIIQHYQIQHCFLFQQMSHVVSWAIRVFLLCKKII